MTMLGKRHTTESIKKMKLAKKGKSNHWKGKTMTHWLGAKNPNWKGGVSKQSNYNTLKHTEWTNKNREYKYFLNMKRVVLRANAEGSHTFEEWLEIKAKHNNTCLSCGLQEPKIVLTQDHIMPLSKGGTDYISNIQPLCKLCNSRKYNRTVMFNQKGGKPARAAVS